MSKSKIAAVVMFGLSLAACAGSPDGTGPGPRENTGTLLGAGSGALLGAAVAGGGTGNRRAGAAIGALAGGLIGNRIGASLDERDKRLAYEAEMNALERGPSGAPVGCPTPDAARCGSVVPGRASVASGRNCRAYTETIYVDARPQTARGTPCRNPD